MVLKLIISLSYSLPSFGPTAINMPNSNTLILFSISIVNRPMDSKHNQLLPAIVLIYYWNLIKNRASCPKYLMLLYISLSNMSIETRLSCRQRCKYQQLFCHLHYAQGYTSVSSYSEKQPSTSCAVLDMSTAHIYFTYLCKLPDKAYKYLLKSFHYSNTQPRWTSISEANVNTVILENRRPQHWDSYLPTLIDIYQFWLA